MTLVHVRHPAPIRYVPKGGRHQRLAFDRITTPVRLREVSPSEMEPVATVRGAFGAHGRPAFEADLHQHGGSLWTPFLDKEDGPLPREVLIAYLVGEAPVGDYIWTSVPDNLAGTPVLSMSEAGLSRGEPFDRTRAKAIVHDFAGRAGADLTAYVERDILLVGPHAYRRFLGPLVYCNGGSPPGLVLQPRTGFTPCYVVRADRDADLRAFRLAHGLREEHPGAGLPHGLPELPSGLIRDDDLLMFANLAPSALLEEADLLAEVHGATGTAGEMEELAAMRTGMQEVADLGTIGALRDEDVEGIVVMAAAFARQAARCHGGDRLPHDGFLPVVSLYAEHFALPRLREQRPTPEDDEAFAGIVPGP